ncbi:MAG: hypothetical protein CMG46_10020 [Candidatus Marinimicrobia bacterium]|nr:hypothetical protein [Candidatus Neomarinimicrobiota bacterium]
MKQSITSALYILTCLAFFGGGVPALAESTAINIDSDDIAGVVTGPNGPESGAWVIAETDGLATRMIKIVVTDNKGRFVLPDLPDSDYYLWTRAYGRVDSDSVEAKPGSADISLKLKAAPNEVEAAQIYPANYWFSLIEPPPKSDFPGTGPNGNGINPGFSNQQRWMAHLKEQCHYCHQIGTKSTRDVAGANKVEAWNERLKMARPEGDPTVAVHGATFSATMQNNMTRFGRQRGLSMFADWSERIENGAIPSQPPRPSGIERNIVITLWDWASEHFVHDEATSDKRDPTVNAYGPVYGVDSLAANLAILDPISHATEIVPIPNMEGTGQLMNTLSVHNPMLDQKGRVWMTMLGGEGASWEVCEDPKNKYANYYPNPNPAETTRRISMYDPETKEIKVIPVCFGTHHINWMYDDDNTVVFSGDTQAVGWLNTRVWDETKDAEKSIGWCPFVIDTNGDGKIDSNRENWNKPDGINVVQGDAKKDTRISGFPYGLNINPLDNSIWYAKHSPSIPSGLVRIERGVNAPETCMTEYWEPPKNDDGTYAAYNARGVDMDSNGIAWVAFGSGQLGKFDRSMCKIKNGPRALGQQCPEGWTFYDTPGPKVTGQEDGSADWHYLTWVDLHNIIGLGHNVPILPGSNSDSLLAFLPDKEEWVVLRIPYPMGFYARGLDGRIDDTQAGWKGRGLWSNYAEVPLWHQEDGFGAYSKMVKFQIRPEPLAH